MNEIKVTVFTPTYNRAYIIRKLFQSLKNQSCLDFEWLVIDDGSTDNTSEIFADILNEIVPFPVTYINKANGGKHRAINDAVKIARGKMFFIVDSDDQLTPDAIEKILSWTSEISEMDGFAGVAGNKGSDNNTIIGDTFDGEWIDATSLEREKNNIIGDKAEVFYTDVLKQFPFPEFEGENFLTEAVVWERIADAGLKIRWFNVIIYICEYREDGLTKNLNKLLIKNPKGYALSLIQKIEYEQYSRRDIINIYYHYYEVVGIKIGRKGCAYNLGINYIYMTYVVFRCRARDCLRGALKLLK